MFTSRSLRTLLVALSVLALVATACGRDEEGDDASSSATTAPGADGSDPDGSDPDGSDPDGSDPDGSDPDGSDPDGSDSALVASAADCEDYDGGAGISDDAIKIGSSFPQSGLYSAFAQIAAGYEAYIADLNESGGIAGRRIELELLDDAYQSGETLANYEDLSGEPVFAMLGVVGTPNNLAIREQQNEDCVPNLFLASGSQFWGNPAEWPWTVGSIPTYPVEMAMLVDYLTENEPDATVAFLYQNDDFGKGYFDAFSALIDGTGIEVVADTTYDSTDPDTTSQITTLSGSEADVLVLATTTLACPNSLAAKAELDEWTPVTYISATCTSSTLMGLVQGGAGDGVLSGFYLKDPRDPQWENDPAMQEFQSVGAAHGLDAEQTENGIVVFGWALGGLLDEVLSGVDLDDPAIRSNAREEVMNAAWHLDGVELPLLLPGITVTTDGAADPYPIESMQLGVYNGTFWDSDGVVYDFEGKSAEFSPPEG